MKPIARIICVGSRLYPEDSAGPLVHDRLLAGGLPADVALVDGGLGGLDLLRYVDDCERVVFVDALDEPGTRAGVYLLDPQDLARQADEAYDHAAGLAFLLRMIPIALDGAVPELHVIGVQGGPDPLLVAKAADTAARLAAGVVGEVAGQP